MKKSVQLLLLLITSLFILVGCSTVQDHVLIKDDGSLVRQLVITIDKTHESYSEEAEIIALERLQKEFEEKGYKYDEKDIVSEGKKVVKIEKEIEPTDKNNASVILFEEDNGITISKEEGFFSTKYITDGNIKVPSILRDGGELVTYQFNVHFPSKVSGDHNAENVTENKTLSWKSDENEEITLQYDVSSINYSNVYLIVGPVLILLILVYYFYRKNNRPTVDNRRIPIKERKRES